MKRLLLILTALLLTGCFYLKKPMSIGQMYNRIDYKARTLTLLTDKCIKGIGIDKPESDYERIDSKKGIVFIGEWYKVEFYHSKPREIVVNIDENSGPNERNLIIWAYRKKDSDAAIILQEGRPEDTD